MSEEYGHTHKKEILIILCLVFLGAIAALSGAFSNNDPAAIASTTTVSTVGSGFSPPAETNSGSLAVTDKKDDEKSKATRIPSPNEIMPTGTLISISNPQKFVKANSNLVITDIEIDKSNNEIRASYLSTDPEKSTIIRPALINFFNKDKNNIFREQNCCRYYGNNDQAETRFGNGYAHCQWPEDFCFISTAQKNGKGWKIWEKYWEEKLGKKQQPQVGSTKFESIIPTIEPGKKYSFTITCEIPQDTNYIKIT